MNTISTFIVVLAILSPAVLYFSLSIGELKNIKSFKDFFPLTRFLKGEVFGRSTAAAGVSLATVILTLINLAPALGISLIVTIASYSLSFLLLYFCAGVILKANPENDTVQGFLGKAYGSASVRNIALLFSFVGYLSIFSMELIVGVTILQPFFGEWTLAFSSIYLIFIIGYSVISGFRATVATEQWHIRFITAAIAVLVLLLPILWINAEPTPSFIEISKTVWSSWNATLAFYLGIIVMNLPAPISDSGTWQRLCATASESEARKGLLRAILMFVMIWGTLIVVGTYIAQIAIASGNFDPQHMTLMNYLIESLTNGGGLQLTLLFIFILGLFAAMITTADTLLIVAAQMFSVDFLRLNTENTNSIRAINKARLSLAVIAAISFLLFAIFHILRFDVVQLIFAIYGAQLAMFPPVAVALFLTRWIELENARLAAILSLIVGFIGSWVAAFYGKYGGDPNWLYYAPVVALLTSTATFLMFSVKAWRRVEHP